MDPAVNQVKTYRYLRIGMMLVIGLLATAIIVEFAKTDTNCLQRSISAYFHTPVRSVFVAALVTVGVCMVIIRGRTDLEDACMNLAGMLAPVVAFVPVSGMGKCTSVPPPPPPAAADAEVAARLAAAAKAQLALAAEASVDNNVLALFITGTVGIVVAAIIVALSARRHGGLLPLAMAAVILVVAWFWFAADDSLIDSRMHYAAAVTLFVFIGVVVFVNAVFHTKGFPWRKRLVPADESVRDPQRRYALAYWTILGAMGVVLFATLAVWDRWDHAVFGIEALLLALFLAFWAIQTKELWFVEKREAEATTAATT